MRLPNRTPISEAYPYQYVQGFPVTHWSKEGGRHDGGYRQFAAT